MIKCFVVTLVNVFPFVIKVYNFDWKSHFWAAELVSLFVYCLNEFELEILHYVIWEKVQIKFFCLRLLLQHLSATLVKCQRKLAESTLPELHALK